MGYRRMRVEGLYDIFRRFNAGQSIIHIAVVEGRDRKTVRNYVSKFLEAGYCSGNKWYEKEKVIEFLKHLLPKTGDMSSFFYTHFLSINKFAKVSYL